MSVHIVPATPLHAAAMAKIHAASFPARERWGVDAMALQLGQRGVFGLVDPAGALVLCRVAADEAEILTLAVTPPMRRQGRAQALLRAAVAQLRGAGVRALFLEVSTANEAAQLLYTRAGFREVGRRARYYANGADALVLRLDVSAAAATDA
jgi:[ribosomal protein S18]-alanine N-acetyltransferase